MRNPIFRPDLSILEPKHRGRFSRTPSSGSKIRDRIVPGAVIGFVVMTLVAVVLPFARTAQSAERFTFNGAGWGHGVGMSQYGARNRAEAGASANDILTAYYAGVEITSFPPPDTVRVHLGDITHSSVSTSGTIALMQNGETIGTYGPGVDTSMDLVDGAIVIGDTSANASKDSPIEVSFDEPLTLGAFGHRYYFGKLRLWPVDGEIRVVEFGMSMESYVKGIAEMPSSWPAEALKAQAIAARTYAHFVTNARRSDPEWTQGYDLSASTLDQNYEGYDAAVSAWTDAVDATSTIEMLHSGHPIKAYYSASNGGATETAAVVFDMDLPYTVAGSDPYDADDNSWASWSRTYSAAQLSDWLGRVEESSVGTVQSISIGDGGTGRSGRIDSTPVTVVGSDRTVTLTGRRLMVIINAGVFADGGTLSEHLPSTRVVLDKDFDGTVADAESTVADPESTVADAESTVEEPVAGGDEATSDTIAPIVTTPVKLPDPSVPDTVDVEGPQRVAVAIDRFGISGDRLEIAGYAVDPDASQIAVSVRVAIDGVVGSEVTTVDGRYVLATQLPADGQIKDVCVYAHEVDAPDSATAGCRAIRTATPGGAVVATSAISSSD